MPLILTPRKFLFIIEQNELISKRLLTGFCLQDNICKIERGGRREHGRRRETASERERPPGPCGIMV